MSRYLLLFLLNAPFVIVAITSSLIGYKLGKVSRRKFVLQVILWLIVLAGLAGAYSIYQFLFSQRLTESEPLSLFDVVQVTFIVYLLFKSSRHSFHQEALERRLKDLHQALSISTSEKK